MNEFNNVLNFFVQIKEEILGHISTNIVMTFAALFAFTNVLCAGNRSIFSIVFFFVFLLNLHFLALSIKHTRNPAAIDSKLNKKITRYRWAITLIPIVMITTDLAIKYKANLPLWSILYENKNDLFNYFYV